MLGKKKSGETEWRRPGWEDRAPPENTQEGDRQTWVHYYLQIILSVRFNLQLELRMVGICPVSTVMLVLAEAWTTGTHKLSGFKVHKWEMTQVLNVLKQIIRNIGKLFDPGLEKDGQTLKVPMCYAWKRTCKPKEHLDILNLFTSSHYSRLTMSRKTFCVWSLVMK